MGFSLCGDCTDKANARYDAGTCKIDVKKFGSKRGLFVHCSVTFADILNAGLASGADWSAALGTQDVIVTPKGASITIGDGATSNLIDDGPGNRIPDVTDYTFTITIASSAANYDDVEDYMQKLHDVHQSYRFNWFDYEDLRLYTDHDTIEYLRTSPVSPAAVAYAIGYEVSFDAPPEFRVGPNGRGKAGLWTITGAFSTNNVQRSALIPGLKALIDAEG